MDLALLDLAREPTPGADDLKSADSRYPPGRRLRASTVAACAAMLAALPGRDGSRGTTGIIPRDHVSGGGGFTSVSSTQLIAWGVAA